MPSPTPTTPPSTTAAMTAPTSVTTTEATPSACAIDSRSGSTSASAMRKYWSVMSASSTPMGSLMIPSHLSSEALSLPSRAWRSSGMMTVGPVTTRSAPSTHATGHSRPPT